MVMGFTLPNRTSRAFVPRSIRSIFVTTPRVRSPFRVTGMEMEMVKRGSDEVVMVMGMGMEMGMEMVMEMAALH